MTNESLIYYSPELMALLFFAALILGLIIGFFVWGTKRDNAMAMEQQVSELNLKLDRLRNERLALREKVRTVN